MDGASRRACRVLTVNLLPLEAANMFERVDIAENFYEGVVEPSYKNLLYQMLTMIVTAVK